MRFFRPRFQAVWFFLCVLLVSGCRTNVLVEPAAGGREAQIYSSKPISSEYGIASWYGGRWIGRRTANGEIYRAQDVTAAHKKLPFHTMVRVVDLKTGKSTIVRINNRGPFVRGRVIDLSVVAAQKLGTYARGIAKVRVEVLRKIPVLSSPNVRASNPPKPPAQAKPSATPEDKSPPESRLPLLKRIFKRNGEGESR
jgi:rare lipoprotein A